MKIVVTGSSGLVGKALCRFWEKQGHQIFRLVRGKPDDRQREFFWDYLQDIFDWSHLEGMDVIVHLAGSPVVGRWTARRQRLIRDSRVRSTQHLVQSIEQLAQPPRMFVCASAIGYYGGRDNEVLTEQSGLGESFLTDVCQAWEAASSALPQRGIRTVNLRLGMVLANEGGALPKMLPAFRFGLGGRLGPGTQYMSWIHLADVVRAIDALVTANASGPYNLVAPNPVTNAEFTHALGATLHRPTLLPVPAFVLRLVLGQMADELLLGSTRAIPQGLQDLGFSFDFPTIDAALGDLLT